MLSRLRSRSPIPPNAATTTTTDALSDAIKSFQDCLDSDQKARLEAIKAVPDAHAVAQFTHQLDQENAKRKSRCVAARISPLLESVQQFAGIVETFVSSNPHIAALVWGSVKLVLQIASNFTTYFDKLSALLMTIGKRCPRFQEYQKLYRDSTDLQKALCDFYSMVVRCCEQAVTVLRRAGYIQLLKAVTSSFSLDFASIMMQIDQSSKEVNETILLTEAKLDTAERQDQRAEREAAERYRLSSMLYRKERERTEADRMAQMQLEKHKIQEATKLEQFCNYNHKIAYWKARTQRHGSTGQWLTQSEDFRRWVTESGSSVFWFTGILGSGKTVMTAFVVEQLSANSSQGTGKLAYFFCQYDNETSLKASTVLRSIIRQLVDQDDQIFTANLVEVNALLDNTNDLTLLVALFSGILESLKSVVVVLDGVDECSNSEMKFLLKALRGLMSRKPSGLKLYLSGDDRITDLIISFLTPSFVVNTHTPEAASDLQELIQQLVTVRREDEDLVTGDPTLYQEIIDVLCSASKGMVLWVSFQLEEICSQKTDESIRSALKHLPKDLSETYNRLLSRIVEESSLEVCNKIFRFMAAAKKPLLLEELGEAISVEPCQLSFMPERSLNDINGIVRWCHGLIALNELDGTLQFTHSSVKDFLCHSDTERITLPGFHFGEHEADRQFGEVCVTYLNFNDFNTQLVTPPKPEMYLDPMVMANYALTTRSSSLLLDKARYLMRRRAKSNLVSSKLFDRQTDSGTSNAVTVEYHLLQYASDYWLSHTTGFSPAQGRVWSLFLKLVEDRYDISSEHRSSNILWYEDPGVLAFHNAIFPHNHQTLFRLYLSRYWNERDLALNLSLILRWKRFSFVKLLPPLAKQPESSWLEAVLSLELHELSKGLTGAGTGWIHELTLTERSRLLAKVVETNHLAATNASKALVELGVDPYHEFDDHGKTTTILVKLIRHSDTELLKKLCSSMVESNADFERKIALNNRTALHIAVILRRYMAVGILLDHGADVDATDDSGYTALHLAVIGEASTTDQSDVLNLVSQLLMAGATQNVKDSHGRTALDHASHDFERRLREQFMKYRIFLD